VHKLTNSLKKRNKLTLMITSISILVLLLISPTTASANSWEFSPLEPVCGDTISIKGNASPEEKVDVSVTFEKTLPVSEGKFEYVLEDVKIPEGLNNLFTVEARGAKNLNVRAKIVIWVTKSSEASGDTAIVSQSHVPPGTYTIRIDGDAGEGVSEVNLKITALQGIEADSNGDFSYSYNTKAVPSGNFEIKVGDTTKRVTIQSETDSDSNSGSSSISESSHHSSSGSGDGSIGNSPELQKNVEHRDTAQTFVSSGKDACFNFKNNVTVVNSISFESKETIGKTTAIAEDLKNQSALVPELPDGDIYKSFNVWVGNGDYEKSDNILNATINFKVENSWVQENNINKSSIVLHKYDYKRKEWIGIPVNSTGKDRQFMYLTANVPGYSSFVLTGTKNDRNTISTETAQRAINSNESGSSSNITSNKAIKIPKLPGLGLFGEIDSVEKFLHGMYQKLLIGFYHIKSQYLNIA